MSKKLEPYYFIKVTDGECVRAMDDGDALVKAIQKKIIDPTKLNDYAVVYKRDDGTVVAGSLGLNIDWDG